MAEFPTTRLRRTRATDWSRRLVRENALSVNDLIWTLIVSDKVDPEPVASMPGVDRLTVKGAAKAARDAQSLGIPANLFPYRG